MLQVSIILVFILRIKCLHDTIDLLIPTSSLQTPDSQQRLEYPPSYQHPLDLSNSRRSQSPSCSPSLRPLPHGLPYTHASESLPQNPAPHASPYPHVSESHLSESPPYSQNPHASPYSSWFDLPPSHQPPLDQPNSQPSQSVLLASRPHGLENCYQQELELLSDRITGGNQNFTPYGMKGAIYYLAITLRFIWFKYDLEQVKQESTDTKSVYQSDRQMDTDSYSDSDYTDGYKSESVIGGSWTIVVFSCVVLCCVVFSCVMLCCVVLCFLVLSCVVLCCDVLSCHVAMGPAM